MKIHEDKIILKFDLPEFERDEIKVKFPDNRIHVTASRHKQIKQRQNGFFHDEKTSCDFEYETTLPKNVYTKNAKIDFSRGVLKIEIPKH